MRRLRLWMGTQTGGRLVANFQAIGVGTTLYESAARERQRFRP